VRNAIAADIPAMIELDRQSPEAAHWSEPQYANLFNEETGSHRLVLVIERVDQSNEGPQVTGFLVALYTAAECELENIVVATAARGKGIGTKLVKELFARVKQSGSESVLLEVRESNQPARALYEKLGFQQMGRRKSYYSNPFEDAVLYVRRVRAA